MSEIFRNYYDDITDPFVVNKTSTANDNISDPFVVNKTPFRTSFSQQFLHMSPISMVSTITSGVSNVLVQKFVVLL